MHFRLESMIKIRLSDPTGTSKDKKEYILDEKGNVVLDRTMRALEENSNWSDYSAHITKRVIGYVKLEVIKSGYRHYLKTRAELSSFTSIPSKEYSPVILCNGILCVEASIHRKTIEELVFGFDMSSIPAEKRVKSDRAKN